MTRLRTIAVELTHHFPFSLFSASAGIVVVGLITVTVGSYRGQPPASTTAEGIEVTAPPESLAAGQVKHGRQAVEVEPAVGKETEAATAGATETTIQPRLFTRSFHVFHPIHILFSAMATAAMFWRFDRKILRAVVTGFVGSVGICGVSDILIPFLGGLASGKHMRLHICVVEHPSLVIPFAVLGVVVGIIAADTLTDRRSTIFSHSSHVLVSTMASLLYLISFGFTDWMDSVFRVLAIVVIAVILPCCTSDIVFPLLIASPEAKARAACCHGDHSER